MITKEEKQKVLKALRDSYANLTAEYTTEKEFENIIEAMEIVKKLTLTDVVSSFITAEDEGKYFVVNTDYDDGIEKGSTVYLLQTYPEDVHLFTDKNGDEVWISADDVDRKE